MMVLTFSHEPTGDIAIVKVQGKDIIFGTMSGGKTQYTPIEGLKFSIAGILKEFPDLEGKPVGEIRKEGLRRFKEHFYGLLTWESRKNYLRDDLAKHGYKLVYQQLPGQRMRKV